MQPAARCPTPSPRTSRITPWSTSPSWMPPSLPNGPASVSPLRCNGKRPRAAPMDASSPGRSEEHTSELQSLRHLVCRLLLEKKNNRDAHGQRTQHYGVVATSVSQVSRVRLLAAHCGEQCAHGPVFLSYVDLFLFFFKEAPTPQFLPLSPPPPLSL